MLGVLERRRDRERYIREYRFPLVLRDKIREEHPQLAPVQVTLMLDAQCDWFVACLRSRRTIGMPSRVVDTAWHEFILLTRAYHDFCEHAFGRYLHHDPAGTTTAPMARAMQRAARALNGTRRRSRRGSRCCSASTLRSASTTADRATVPGPAGVAELADAPGLGPGGLRPLEVRLLSPALAHPSNEGSGAGTP